MDAVPTPPIPDIASMAEHQSPPLSGSEQLHNAHIALAQEVHKQTLSRRLESNENGHTSAAYRRHFERYQNWWNLDQARRLAEAEHAKTVFVSVPALPVTATKAALFLEHERTRPTVSEILPTIRIS
jgi:hypothetical protein